MTKLCPRGKAAAKRKFAVYPSAYANAYASKICAGKIKDPSGVKRKDFKGPKPAGKAMGGRIRKVDGGEVSDRQITKRKESIFKKRPLKKNMSQSTLERTKRYNAMIGKYDKMGIKDFEDVKRAQDEGRLPRTSYFRKTKFRAKGGMISERKPSESVMDRLKKKNAEAMKKLKEKREAFESKGGYRSGGMTMMPRATYGKGGGVCKKGMGRAYGKNS